MAACTVFINIIPVPVYPIITKLLITMLKRDKKIVKRYLPTLFVILLLSLATSCKTCKCPAYSQTEQKQTLPSIENSSPNIQHNNTLLGLHLLIRPV